MTRIIAGIAKGRNLKVPPSGTRPTSDRVREAVFTSLTSRLGNFAELSVLDLYAGSGAFALEAMSRGAANAVLVEKHPATASVIKENAKITGFDVEVKTSDVKTYLNSSATMKFDVVYIDPPYDHSNEEVEQVLKLLIENGYLAQEGIVVVERSARGEQFTWPEGYEQVQERSYGETLVKSGVC
ncbi:MAG: rRNA ((966)-N(2))-methyltransferase [Actinomycetota bacterium]|jgi:16S rRNA (guanine966-N2)-methyltransferase